MYLSGSDGLSGCGAGVEASAFSGKSSSHFLMITLFLQKKVTAGTSIVGAPTQPTALALQKQWYSHDDDDDEEEDDDGDDVENDSCRFHLEKMLTAYKKNIRFTPVVERDQYHWKNYGARA